MKRCVLVLLGALACSESSGPPPITVRGVVHVAPVTVQLPAGGDSTICHVVFSATASPTDTLIQYAIAAYIGSGATLWSTGAGGEFRNLLSTALVTPLADSVRPEFYWHSGTAAGEFTGATVACDGSSLSWNAEEL